jgi:hypothetical protein
MRCLSPHSKYSIQVIEADEQVVTNPGGFAQLIPLKKGIVANFRVSGLLDHEAEYALMNFGFTGLPDGINPLSRVAVFDTEEFAESLPAAERDALVVQIEQRLEVLAERNNEFAIVPMPRAERPWPSYDEFDVEDILKFQERLRMSPDKIRLYELENANRPEIVLAMLRKSDPEAAKAFEAESAGGSDESLAPSESEQAEPELEPVTVEA